MGSGPGWVHAPRGSGPRVCRQAAAGGVVDVAGAGGPADEAAGAAVGAALLSELVGRAAVLGDADELESAAAGNAEVSCVAARRCAALGARRGALARAQEALEAAGARAVGAEG